MDSTTITISCVVVALLGLAGGFFVGRAWGRLEAAATTDQHSERRADHEVVLADLDRLGREVTRLHEDRARWRGELGQQVAEIRGAAESLGQETRALTNALRRPQVRGRWGELHLRRTVELAGMVAHCDFTEQQRLAGGARRPDLVIHLAGGRDIAVDAKVPLEAFLAAAEQPDSRELHLERHAGQVRAHVDALAGKRYWQALPRSPEFVVMFLPGEPFLSAALDSDRTLLEYAAYRDVVLATPTTMIALLRTVARGWREEALAEQAAEIHRLGRDLHERLGTLGEHLDRLGRSLDTAVGHFNRAVGSLESRVLVSARRFTELSVTDQDLPEPRPVQTRSRAVSRLDVRRAADPPADHDPRVAL